jgi:predicted O-linked N-acetylglucosamine transferase (SPINDLY family)
MLTESPRRDVPDGPPARELAFQQALSLRKQGDPLRADALCAEVLEIEPRHFNAYHLRGLIAFDQGDIDRGIEFIERSLATNPHQPLAYSNLGNALLSAGRPQLALDQLDQALRLKSDLVIAHYNRGNALKALGRLEEALASYDAALQRDGSHAKALNNRGLVLQELGRHEEARYSYVLASNLDPRLTAPRKNLAAVLLRLDRSAEALAVSDHLLAREPHDPEILCGRGNALLALQRLEEARECYSRALKVNPQCVEALMNRSSVLQRQRQLEAALEDCECALELAPESVLALGNAGNVLLGLDRVPAALACFDRAFALAPGDCSALHGRGASLLKLERFEEAAQAFAQLLRLQPDHHSALGNLFHLRMEQCDWHEYGELSSRVIESLRRTKKFVNPLSLLLVEDAETTLACARAFVEEMLPLELNPGPFPPPAGFQDRNKIRVAYVSADFCDHPVSQLLVGVLERHDREAFEVIGVALRPRRSGSFEQRVHDAFDRWIDASGMSDREVAELMREWGVDIALDLMGFTEGSRLGIFGHRAAPVQVSYLGYAGTVGAPFMDYLLADEVVIPPDHERWYDERVVRLPHCYLPTDDRRLVAMPPTRGEAGLPPQGFIFCAFTKAHKINPPVFDVWMRLLRETDGSVLWLRDMGAAARANLTREAGRLGVDGSRLVFAPRVASSAEHLGRLALADLYLDTQPHNAHSTTCDALWAGVPVLTCLGSTFASRVAASALAAAGLPELITHSLAEYERCALDLVRRPERLGVLRSRLTFEGRQSPLFDTAGYTGHLEAAFRRMQECRVQ